MKIISNKELNNIYGGLNISGTLINAFTGAMNSILEIGRSLGTALRRIIGKGKICKI